MDWICSMHDIRIDTTGNPVADCSSLHQQKVTFVVNVSFEKLGRNAPSSFRKKRHVLNETIIKTLRR